MSDLRKAAEMALDALEQTPTANKLFDESSYEARKEAIEALRQALAQPEKSKTYAAEDITAVVEAMVNAFKLRREWVGLTDEEIFEHEWWNEETAFAVNKTLKEKNT